MDVLLLAFFCFIFCSINEACTKFTSNSNTLDLSCIENMGVIEFLYANTYYNYSACSNSASCIAVGTDCMVSQGRGNSKTDCAAYLATWDNGVQKATYASSIQTWYFNYSNGYASGGCSTGRKLNLVFVCDYTADPIDENTITVLENPSCTYTLTAKSILACPDGLSKSTKCGSSNGGGGSSSSSGLSGGWIFIILLLCGFFLYCAIGYVWTGRKNEQGFGDFKNNIPNRGFWVLLPKYVTAGCGVSKDFMVGLANRGKGDGESKSGALASGNTAE